MKPHEALAEAIIDWMNIEVVRGTTPANMAGALAGGIGLAVRGYANRAAIHGMQDEVVFQITKGILAAAMGSSASSDTEA